MNGGTQEARGVAQQNFTARWGAQLAILAPKQPRGPNLIATLGSLTLTLAVLAKLTGYRDGFPEARDSLAHDDRAGCHMILSLAPGSP